MQYPPSYMAGRAGQISFLKLETADPILKITCTEFVRNTEYFKITITEKLLVTTRKEEFEFSLVHNEERKPGETNAQG